MQVKFVAGFAPIVTDLAASRALYADALGIAFQDGDYPMTDDLPGITHFGLWSLAGAAQSCFGTDAWPADLPVPQGSLEFDVESAEAVAAAAAELAGKGHRVLVGPKTDVCGPGNAVRRGPGPQVYQRRRTNLRGGLGHLQAQGRTLSSPRRVGVP